VPPSLVPKLDALDVRASALRFTRELSVATAVVLLLGLGAAASATDGGPIKAHKAVAQEPAAVLPAAGQPTRTPAKPPAAPRVTVTRKATKSAATHVRHLPAKPVKRYLPTGTGMWIHNWEQTEGGNAGAVVRRANQAGLTHVYVQTGSSKKGWIGQEVLSELLPATRGTDLKVIAWDFPKLRNPEDDARRLSKAAWWRQPGVPMVAAVAPDIETLAEGTYATPDSITRYYRTLRASLPARVAILATVPWPSEKRLTRYAYTRTALYADAFIPMAYWYNRSPSVVTRTSMQVLAQFGKPVFPVGQGYDGRLDAPYLKPDPTPGKSVDAFVQAAHAGGAESLSLWSWQTTGPEQWASLIRAAGRYAPPAPAALIETKKSKKSGWHPGKQVGTP